MINLILANHFIFLGLCLLVLYYIIAEYRLQKKRKWKVKNGELFEFNLSRAPGVYYLLLITGIVLVLWGLIDLVTPSTVVVAKEETGYLGGLLRERASLQAVTKLRSILLLLLGFYGILRSYLFWGVVHWEVVNDEMYVYRNHQFAFSFDTSMSWQITLLDDIILIENSDAKITYTLSNVKIPLLKEDAFLNWLSIKGIT